MKRILILADINSAHTEKWAMGLADKGFTIGIFGLHKPVRVWFLNRPDIVYLNTDSGFLGKTADVFKFSKVAILPRLKKAIAIFKPDILHAHYATSYGLLANLSGFRPYFISVWGTDIMQFPKGNYFKKKLLVWNLKNASKVFATSASLKKYTQDFASTDVEVIPFGVDTNYFKPGLLRHEAIGFFRLACIKSLETVYCIDTAIRAFDLVKKRHPEIEMEFIIGGDGSQKNQLMALCEALNLQNEIIFKGRLTSSTVVECLQEADVFINISLYESFGVSVVEAMACEKPVIVTHVDGLKEVVSDGEEGIHVPVKDVTTTAEAIEHLLLNPVLRNRMGAAGRTKVLDKYNWSENLQRMSEIYANFEDQ
jgi:glycosyltransferase involved in cell wall biosynthesis